MGNTPLCWIPAYAGMANKLAFMGLGVSLSCNIEVHAFTGMTKRNGNVKDIINFVYDGWQVIEEQNAAGELIADYVYGLGIDEPLRMRRDLNEDAEFDEITETFYYHENSIGSIFAITDGEGTVVERYDYTTYGVPVILDADYNVKSAENYVGNPYMFHGGRIDWVRVRRVSMREIMER